MSYEPGVTVITCTGGRPEALQLCAGFVLRQTYAGPLQWLLVNDCWLPDLVGEDTGYPWQIAAGMDLDLKEVNVLDDAAAARHLWAHVINPRPIWRPGQNTLARNLLAAIPHVRYDKVVFVEDDEHYPEHWIEVLVDYMGEALIAGDPMAPYYHLPSRRYRLFQNTSHCSLGQTAMRSEALSLLQRICEDGPDCIDYRLWRLFKKPEISIVTIVGFASMKGLPGRHGIGIGHHPERNPELWKTDPDMSVLRSWIGSDCDLYERFSR